MAPGCLHMATMNYSNYCKSVEFLRRAKSRVYLLPLSSPRPPAFLSVKSQGF
ncbi:hypothetical protein ACRRTK_021706 [Alexandromys fortis]